jgi:ribosomal protein S27AE
MPEKPKVCPVCGSLMIKRKRAHPEGGPLFVASDEWVCLKCGIVEPDED